MAVKNTGTVVQVIGPVLDIRFADGSMPELLNAIEVEHNGNKVVDRGQRPDCHCQRF